MQGGSEARERRLGGGGGGEAEWELSCSMFASGLVVGHGSGRKMFLFVACFLPLSELPATFLIFPSLPGNAERLFSLQRPSSRGKLVRATRAL